MSRKPDPEGILIILRRTPFERGTKIELLEGDKVVSSLRVFDTRMRIGAVPVRCGGIGDLYTEREYRLKGHSRRVFQETIASMQEEGYHLSFLFGIPRFYDKFGYASGTVHSESWVATRDAEAAVPCYEVREFAPQDARAVAEIYEQMHAHRTASIVRDPATWTGFQRNSDWGDCVGAFVVADGPRIIGYASYDQSTERCALGEVGYAGPAVFSTLLAEAARRAVELRVERITIHMPPDDPFVRYCCRYGCETRMIYPRWSDGMGRIVNQHALFTLLQPLLERRLRASERGDWGGTVALETDLGQERLGFGVGGKELGAGMPQWILAQLLLGYRSVRDALLESEAHADEELVPILQALFPQGYPYIWVSDRF